MKQFYEIALATDSNYIIPTTVLLKSLFVNNKECDFVINILYLSNRLLSKDLCFLQKYVGEHGHRCRFLPVSESELDSVPDCRHTKSTYLRLFLPQLMPTEVEKVLYMDSDIVISGSIQKLLQLDLDSFSLAAVKESINIYDKFYLSPLGIPLDRNYFNAGVIYLNLKKMREENAVVSCFSFLESHLDVIKANDQDVLNGVFWDSVKFVSPIYNFNYWMEKDVALKLFSKEEYEMVKMSPCIIHYIGPVKPWSFLSMHPKKRVWWHYLKQTPFKTYEPVGKSAKNIFFYPFFFFFALIKRNLTMRMKQQIGLLLPSKIKTILKISILKVQ